MFFFNKGKWRVGIQSNKYGSYDDPVFAARVYNKLAQQIYGDVAILNQLDDDPTFVMPEFLKKKLTSECVFYLKKTHTWRGSELLPNLLSITSK